MGAFHTSLTVVTAPAVPPVTLAQAKAFLRVDTDDDDDLITALITAATEFFEDATNRKLITQTLAYRLDEFPDDGEPIELSRFPVQSITSIQYVDENGDTQTWDAASYAADLHTGRILPDYGEVYPTTRDQAAAVTVTFVAGYGDEDGDVPESVKTCVKQLVAHWYEERQPAGKDMKELPFTLQALIMQHKIFSFGR